MKIFSKQRDYYDSILAYGQDDKLVFKRATETVPKPQGFDSLFSSIIERDDIGRTKNHIEYETGFRRNSQPEDKIHVESLLVGFCGELYPVLRISFFQKYHELLLDDEDGVGDVTWMQKVKYCHSTEQVISTLKEHKHLKEHLDLLLDDKKGSKYRRDYLFYSSGKGTWKTSELDKFFKNYRTECPVNAFSLLNAPYFMFKLESSQRYADEVMVTKLPLLTDLNFHSVVDPYTAFQSISMYLSGVLGLTEVDTVSISDTDMRDAKGFHDMSFKKRPQKS